MTRIRPRRFDVRLVPVGVVRLVAMAVVAGGLVWGMWRASGAATPGGDVACYHGRNARVVGVIDGDTLLLDLPDGQTGLDRTRVRLIGVDTPETVHPDRPVEYFGPEASAFTTRQVLGKMVELRLDSARPARDRYGRLLAYVICGGDVLNEQLIRMGYGRADSRFDHPLRDRFLQLQKQARRDRIGLWRQDD